MLEGQPASQLWMPQEPGTILIGTGIEETQQTYSCNSSGQIFIAHSTPLKAALHADFGAFWVISALGYSPRITGAGNYPLVYEETARLLRFSTNTTVITTLILPRGGTSHWQ